MSPAERQITGIHHVTAIASDPQPNLDFYLRFLGLRLVKRTVNFDDPETYHLYFGDETGRPGTILTFFPWPGARRGRQGLGQVTATSFAVPAATLDFWRDRAARYGFEHSDGEPRFGEPVLQVTDPDGLAIELIAGGAAAPDTADGLEVPPDWAIRSIHSATALSADVARSTEMLTTLGFREAAREGNRIRFASEGPGFYDLVAASGSRGLGGAGTVHHIAFRTPAEDQQLRWQQALLTAGYQVSSQTDRKYFRSIYFREPGGILFEIATDPPGFLVDEPADALGSALMLPAEYEPRRAAIEAALPPITVPSTGLAT